MVVVDSDMFRAYIRMTVVEYENLLLQVGSKLISAPTRHDLVTPSQKLMTTLSYSKYTKIVVRFLATGESFVSLRGQYHIGVAIIHGFIPKVLKVIWETLQPTVLKMPSNSKDWQKVIDVYYKKWQFPHCWGALDGKKIVIEAML
ncbi:uncharacterized protein LOC117176636 [Belonocnema kinseyi]|uniref:uncharacterized protein LOC117176636 n=1 Tax=Belonocnema kinseyi TaxID=2817044 RepID=UPI00143DBBC1|nr:uncharacterized protein LOC117176636 [Belonocnema kinseyi]